ncbi:MAG TPA: hypothetical protein VEK57_31655 [Thermoanaerobaculia bacterium]|nr:hypothetical protein [Thermoanaerobaculia bacterium]
MKPPADTSPRAWAVQQELLRRLPGVERLKLAQEWTRLAHELAFAHLRSQHPELPDEELWLKLAVRRLGRSVVRKVTGRDIDPS